MNRNRVKSLFYFFIFIGFTNFPLFAMNENSFNSVPREYFSMHIVNFGNHPVQVGKDEINNTFVILPSPKIRFIQPLGNGQKDVRLDLYPIGIGEFLSQKLNTPNISFLYILSLDVYDNNGQIVKRLFIPDGVSLAPPQYIQFPVSENSSELTIVYSFVGRSGWSNYGISADAMGLYEEFRKLGVASASQLSIDIKTEDGRISTYEALNTTEDNLIDRTVSFFQNFVLWGEVPDKIFNLIQQLEYSQPVKIDFADYVNSLNEYPQIFTDMTKWQSVIKTLASEKYHENELEKKLNAAADFGFKDLFNLKGSFSEEKKKRSVQFFKLNMEGDLYVPKSINFVLRKQHVLDLAKSALIRSYKDLQEQKFKFGSSVVLKSPQTAGFPISVKCVGGSGVYCGTKANFVIDGGSDLHINLKTWSGHCAPISVDVYVDDVFRTRLGPFTYQNAVGEHARYKKSDELVVPSLSSQPHKISLEGIGMVGGCIKGPLSSWSGNLEVTYDFNGIISPRDAS